MSKTIKLNRKIKATPEEIYIALTNPFTIELWSGEPAEMNLEPGSEFSMLGGEIIGRNLEFQPFKLLRQQWYFHGEELDSEVTINLIPEKNYTIVQIEQTGVPDNAFDNMLKGWKNSYLQSLQDFFEA
ncbi:MAG TPA: SRPBCC domain-containing protein [Bacteroidales bacterium]|nr:SRPBCC domain-containing protein [Bacteroidales bacterium]